MSNSINDFALKPEDLFTSEFKTNAYPIYEKLRKEGPIHRLVDSNGYPMWLVTSYEEANAVLKDNRFIKDSKKLMDGGQTDASEIEVIAHSMLFADPPNHTRLRKLVQKAFTPKMVKRLRGRIQQIADELLDQVQGKGEMDLIDDYAFPLPIIVISEMLGIPTEDRDKFRKWSDVLIDGTNTREEYEQKVVPATKAFIEYLTVLLDERRKNPKDDLISALLLAEEEGDKLTEHELYGMIVLLIIAGHETTVNLIGNGVLALLEHPEQLELLKNDPSLIHSAVEEMLRFYSPVEFSTERWSGEDIHFNGKEISKGELMVVSLASANRDRRQFEDPDRFDITRQKNQHIAFGTGIHHCVGAPLARLEGEIAINTLLRRIPEIRLKGDPASLEWRPSFIIRGLKQFPIHI